MKNHTVILVSIILIAPFISCKEKIREDTIIGKQSVIVAGNVMDANSKTVSIAFHNMFKDQSHFTQIIDSLNGTFKFEFLLFHPQDVGLNYGNKILLIFLEPGDSIYLSIGATDESNSQWINNIEFSGNNFKVNQELMEFNLSFSAPEFGVDPKGKSVKYYLTELEKQILAERAELDSFITKHKPTNTFRQWAEKDIIYRNANFLIDFKVFNNPSRIETDSLFCSNVFPINNDSNLYSSMFSVHLKHFIINKYSLNDLTTNASEEKQDNYKLYKCVIDSLLNNEPKGLIRELMIYDLLGKLRKQSQDDYIKLFEKTRSHLENDVIIVELEKNALEKEGKYDFKYWDNISYEEKGMMGDFYNQIVKESNESLVYLNIWAVWCGPCRNAIPYLAQLNDSIQNHDIKIISVCTNSDKDTWNHLVQENKIPGEHYYLDNSQSELFRSRLNFTGFPTYMIIRNGEILNNKAPRPMNLSFLIDELKKNELGYEKLNNFVH